MNIGLRQKDQIKVLEEFKKGALNVIIATSVAEEGLDIGEVDLIVCFDSGMSPIRLTQRMGRTGRKRNGRIFLLLTEKEQANLRKSQQEYRKLNQQIKLDKESLFQFYKNSPRMVSEQVQSMNLSWIN